MPCYLRTKTEVRGALHLSAIWDLHYQNCLFRFVVGPRCNRTIGSRGSPKKESVLEKNRPFFIELDPNKGSFRGCSGSRSCAEQRQTCIGGDAWVSGGSIAPHTGYGTSQVVAQIILHFGKKRKIGPNIASFNDHAHVICWNYEKSSCTCGFLVKFWYQNILCLSPNSK